MREELDSLIQKPLGRRGFVKGMGMAGLGVAGAAVLGGRAFAQSAPTPTPLTDIDILNFALNLEYLEAEFYTVATFGETILSAGVITADEQSGSTTGGHVVPNFAASDLAYIAEALRTDEQAHVAVLRQALGSAAIPKPAINLDALGIGFGNEVEFLTLARAFEDVGTSAYAGAIGLLTNPTFISTAARIAETEAQHSGTLRDMVIQRGVTVPPTDALDIVPTPQTPWLVDSMALTVARTAQQVLAIVYAGGATSGGFFPQGVNGTIKSSQ